MMIRAGFTGRRLGPHTLRHTFATHFVINGGSVAVLQRILGHDDLRNTQIYISLAGVDLERQHAQFGLLAGESPARQVRLLAAAGAIATRVDDVWTCDVATPSLEVW